MFSKLALFAVASFAIFVAALPSPGGSGITNSCNGGQVYCCNSVQPASSDAAQNAISELGVLPLGVLIPVASSVGLTCDPINVLAINKQACTSQTTCCSGNNFKGAVVLACNNIHVGGP